MIIITLYSLFSYICNANVSVSKRTNPGSLLVIRDFLLSLLSHNQLHLGHWWGHSHDSQTKFLVKRAQKTDKPRQWLNHVQPSSVIELRNAVNQGLRLRGLIQCVLTKPVQLNGLGVESRGSIIGVVCFKIKK